MTPIFGFPACKARLDQMLSASAQEIAAAAPGAGRDDAANRWADAFVDFANASRAQNPADQAEVDAIAKLDTLALKTSDDATAAAISGSVAAIVARAAELAAITLELNQAAANAQSEEKRLRLVPIRDALTSIGDTITSAKALARSLDAANPDEQAIISGIDDLVARFAALRTTLDNAPGAN